MISHNPYDQPLSTLTLAAILSRRGRLLATIFIFITAAAALFALFMPAVYESSAKVLVNFQDDYEKQSLGRSSTTAEQIATEAAILRTKSMIEPVVAALGLAEEEDTALPWEKRIALAVERVMSDLRVEREKDTNVLNVTFAARSPERAADVVNGIVEQYRRQRPRLSRDERAYEFFDREIALLKARIDSLEADGLEFKNAQQLLVADRQSEIMFGSLAEFDRELTRVRAQRIARQARLQVLNEQLSTGHEIAAASFADGDYSNAEHLNQMRQNLLQLKQRYNGLRLKYTDKHPEVQAVLHDIEITEAEIKRQMELIKSAEETKLRTLTAQENELARKIGELAAGIADMSRKEFELGKRTIDIEDLKQVYSALLRHREEARIAANKKEFLVQVRVLEEAQPALRPARPNRKLYIALGVAVGLIAAIITGFALENFDRSIYTPEDAESATGLMLIAVVSEGDRRALPTGLKIPLEASSRTHSSFRSL